MPRQQVIERSLGKEPLTEGTNRRGKAGKEFEEPVRGKAGRSDGSRRTSERPEMAHL